MQTNIDKLVNSKPKKPWYLYIIHGVAAIGAAYISFHIKNAVRETEYKKSVLRKKIKHFNPVIRETLLGQRVDWVGREKPLTDAEVENLLKS